MSVLRYTYIFMYICTFLEIRTRHLNIPIIKYTENTLKNVHKTFFPHLVILERKTRCKATNALHLSSYVMFFIPVSRRFHFFVNNHKIAFSLYTFFFFLFVQRRRELHGGKVELSSL